MHAGDFGSRNMDAVGVLLYTPFSFRIRPLTVRKSARIRMPRSDTAQRFASVAASAGPSPKARNSPTSMAADRAVDFWCPINNSKTRAGDGASAEVLGCMETPPLSTPRIGVVPSGYD